MLRRYFFFLIFTLSLNPQKQSTVVLLISTHAPLSAHQGHSSKSCAQMQILVFGILHHYFTLIFPFFNITIIFFGIFISADYVLLSSI